MADELLSQAELETLLRNSKSGLTPKVHDSAGHGVPAPHRSRSFKPASRGKSRAASTSPEAMPECSLDREALVEIRSLHEAFGRGASAALSAQLRSVVEVKLASVEQLSYGQFVARLPNPTCASLVRAAPLTPGWVLDMSPSILYAIIDRLLGGGGTACPVARRPLTDIESRLAARITRLLLAELAKAWQHLLHLDLSVERVESNPRLALGVPSDDAVLLVGFESKMNQVRGTFTLCIPTASLEPVAARLAPGTATGRSTPRTAQDTSNATVEVVVHLAETKIAAQELHQLSVGDIIATETSIHSPLVVSLDGTPTFRGCPGAIESRKAVRIEGPLPRSDGGQDAAKHAQR